MYHVCYFKIFVYFVYTCSIEFKNIIYLKVDVDTYTIHYCNYIVNYFSVNWKIPKWDNYQKMLPFTCMYNTYSFVYFHFYLENMWHRILIGMMLSSLWYWAINIAEPFKNWMSITLSTIVTYHIGHRLIPDVTCKTE